jgi:hypothetical protein
MEKSSTGKVHGVSAAAVKQNITPLQVPQQHYRLLRARNVSRRASRAFSPIPEFSSCIQSLLHEDTCRCTSWTAQARQPRECEACGRPTPSRFA